MINIDKMKMIATLFVATLLVSCGNGKDKEANTPLEVDTEVVGPASSVTKGSYVGVVEESASTAVSFTGMGVITMMNVSEGQLVSRGQLIAKMDAQQSLNAVKAAEAQMKQANDALARLQQLHDKNSLPDIKWVEVQSQVAQAQSQLDMTKKALQDCSLTAPVSGIVGKKMLSAGETALPSQAVCTILNINNVKVKVSIPEKEIASITPSTATSISVDALEGETFVGGRIEKGVTADAITHTYDIRINLSNPGQRLLPGMVASVDIQNGNSKAEAESATITVPVRSVQQSADGKHFVWVVKDGKAHRQNITLGETFGNRIEILSGVKSGENVITAGYQKVSEGSAVK